MYKSNLNIIYKYNGDMDYNKFKIPKKKGGFRKIEKPNENLKKIQTLILEEILEKVQVCDKATAFLKGKSITDNAKEHINKRYILNLDLNDFFGNIRYESVYKLFKKIGFEDKKAKKLSRLCTHNGRLPQGAPTSPYISNIICENLDREMIKLCKSIQADYTRYADDITISTNNNYLRQNFKAIEEIINNEGFRLNYKKTRFINKNNKQVVTGIVVNEKINIDKNILKEIRQTLYYCNKYGVENHIRYKNINISKERFRNVLLGRIMFVNNINPKVGSLYINQFKSIIW